MANSFEQQIVIEDRDDLRSNVTTVRGSFFRPDGSPINLKDLPSTAASNDNVDVADATDEASAVTLVNALKDSFNSLQDKLRDANVLATPAAE